MAPSFKEAYMILAIDPGYSTGMAYTDGEGDLFDAYLAKEANEVLERVAILKGRDDFAVIVEDFVGAGPRTKEAIFVLKLVGGITATCYLNDIPCIVQVPQIRIPLINEAKLRLPKGTIIHVVDAYAHALAYLERNSDGQPGS